MFPRYLFAAAPRVQICWLRHLSPVAHQGSAKRSNEHFIQYYSTLQFSLQAVHAESARKGSPGLSHSRRDARSEEEDTDSTETVGEHVVQGEFEGPLHVDSHALF